MSPRASIDRLRSALRYRIAMTFASLAVHGLFRIRVEGREHLPAGPALICFSHQSWLDPFVLMATLPWRPRLFFFGPKEHDMAKGTRNRIMTWTGTAIPFKPEKSDLVRATRAVEAILARGEVVAIAGEGRIHDGEGALLPLDDGAAFFAIRAGVPFVPLAINGTSWLAFGRTIRVRIGVPIPTAGRPTHPAVAALSEAAWSALHELVQGYPDPSRPDPRSPWYRLTEAFNEWPAGGRPSSMDAAATTTEPPAATTTEPPADD